MAEQQHDQALSPYGVRATAGSLRGEGGVVLPHAWTPEGVVAAPATNGAQVLHLAVALCVLNDLYREADVRGIPLRGVAVTADGGFDEGWASTGVHYQVELDAPAADEVLRDLVLTVDEVAEIPRALRAGTEVVRR